MKPMCVISNAVLLYLAFNLAFQSVEKVPFYYHMLFRHTQTDRFTRLKQIFSQRIHGGLNVPEMFLSMLHTFYFLPSGVFIYSFWINLNFIDISTDLSMTKFKTWLLVNQKEPHASKELGLLSPCTDWWVWLLFTDGVCERIAGCEQEHPN